ncbi:hypothetical protein Pla22_03780 [Rubripirellula amarantea]|uniref:Uncharacterized protein n=2 Tax=Rubripirellula amarantea TaxID=2527999 RepID=A0A5C5WSI9_9BACT|nr:hypothetical protein Pla22_03780 [Rubripirellula amarantea]
MRRIGLVCTLVMVLVAGCDNSPSKASLDPEQITSFGLVDSGQGRFDWPISRNGFTVSRPPVYASLDGLHLEPLDEIDQKELPAPETLQGEDWRRFLRALGTNAIHPFEMKPIHLEVARLDVPAGPVSFTFSSNGDRLFVCDGATVTAIAFAEAWKKDIPLLTPSDSQSQRVLWKWNVPHGSIGDPTHLVVTAFGSDIVNTFDWGVELNEGKNENAEGSETPPHRSELLLVAGKQTARLDLETGEVQQSFSTPDGGLDYVVAAADADVVLATTPEGNVFWNDGDAEEWVAVGAQVRPASQYVGRQSVAINSTGDAFIAMLGNQPATVWMQAGTKTVSSVSETQFESAATTVAWADDGRNWFDDVSIHHSSSEPEEGEEISLQQINGMIWRAVSAWPQRAGQYRSYPGMTVVGLRRLQTGEARWCLWDHNSNQGGFSCPTELFDDDTLAKSSLKNTERPTLAVSADASRIAYLDPVSKTPTIRVIYRNPWEQPDSQQVVDWFRFRMLGTEEDRRDIDRVAETIRALPMDLYWARPPEELYNKYVQTIVDGLITSWTNEQTYYRELRENSILARSEGERASQARLKSIGDDYDIATWDEDRYQMQIKEYDRLLVLYDDAFEKFEEWKATGSVTANLAAAALLKAEAWKAYQGISPLQFATAQVEFEKQSKECERICLELLRSPRPPMAVFSLLFDISKGTDATHLSVEPIVRRCVRLYPECGTAHVNLGFWLLPHSDGQVGDTASYLHAAFSNVDPAMREKMFAMAQVRLAEMHGGTDNYFAATGANENRTFNGALQLLREEALANVNWLGPLIWIASFSRNDDMTKAACQYYRERFLFAHDAIYKKYPNLFQQCFEDRPTPR